MEDRNPKVKNQLNTAADEKKRIEELWQNIDCRKLLAHINKLITKELRLMTCALPSATCWG